MGAIPWQILSRHPAALGPGSWGLRVGLAWAGDGALKLDYRLRAPRRALAMPPRTNPAPQDGLWRHSCCEAFIGLPGATAYREFNFSPSGAWAVYEFADERVPLPLPEVAGRGEAPSVQCERRRHAWRLRARIPADLLPKRSSGAGLLLGLAAVVEDRRGDLTYWALAHPCPQPDFHHPGGRVLTWSGPPGQ
ncbi:MAG: DOMON-like domain-containing protein [Chromatiaceae bacterium]|nr:DOMON-like domain-containing protein [Chromatiaceae bacterium]